ncbi:hypothetical protein KEM52_000246 [Ascosphaera acerosa]|nr:hypothetical protein KEM52_000246 [Ascosphaera acerosa]
MTVFRWTHEEDKRLLALIVPLARLSTADMELLAEQMGNGCTYNAVQWHLRTIRQYGDAAFRSPLSTPRRQPRAFTPTRTRARPSPKTPSKVPLRRTQEDWTDDDEEPPRTPPTRTAPMPQREVIDLDAISEVKTEVKPEPQVKQEGSNY